MSGDEDADWLFSSPVSGVGGVSGASRPAARRALPGVSSGLAAATGAVPALSTLPAAATVGRMAGGGDSLSTPVGAMFPGGSGDTPIMDVRGCVCACCEGVRCRLAHDLAFIRVNTITALVCLLCLCSRCRRRCPRYR